MRLEPNISLSIDPKKLPPYKVEVKNINSFKFVEKAVNYEIKRHHEILQKGENPIQETRGWDDVRQKTFSQRVKEDAHDYRYFPEPDIPPITHTGKQIEEIKNSLPELPKQKRDRFQREFNISSYDAEILTREKTTAEYFEEAVEINKELRSKNQESSDPKTIANWIINKKIDPTNGLPATLIKNIIGAKKSVEIDEIELDAIVTAVLAENEKAVAEYKSGKENTLMFLLGQTMKKIGKKVDVNLIKEKIQKKIK
jgi:aspartyl-tRNA(Asn)/glutamyl-tRNA(Gln) amidotransferase subunit B